MFERANATVSPRTPARGTGGVTVIAEAAQGFEGDETLARLLVRAAASAGADAVKFQLVYADELTLPAHRHHELFRALELDDAVWQRIADDARREGIALVFDVFGPRSLACAMAVGAHAVKIHASDVFNHSLVRDALAQAPHLYLSTGGIDASEIAALLDRHSPHPDRLTLLAGFQSEPTETGANNLRRLQSLAARFPGTRFGFMDHADGESDESGWLATLALACGAVAIEKHITLDRELQLEDYVSAVAPAAFAVFVRRLRAAEAALGTGELALTAAEVEYRRKALKVTVARRALAAGTIIGEGDVRLIRTALTARAPVFQLESAIGRRLRHAVATDDAIYEDDLE
jgi:sialic acid synthase SpsE